MTGISADLEVAAGAALAGGRAAGVYYGRDDLVVRDKNQGGVASAGRGVAENPVTLADHAANEAILEYLRERTAEPVLSEESRPPDAAVGQLYLGHVTRGAWLVRAPGTARETRWPLQIGGTASQPLRLIRSRSHPDPALAELESRLAPVDVVISGSVGIKCARIARGEADLYVHPVPFLKEWDTCAPEAVLRGAGGVVTDCSGEPLSYGKSEPLQPRGIFCGRRDAHERVAPIVRDVARHLNEA
jgi:3'-phosphoadenosine 5'-phosphosulfate (PAPS) 3'-phosphatase